MIWRVLLLELVLVVVVAAVWLLAPLVGITSVLWRLVIIFALLLPPLGYVIWRLIERRRAARGLESAIVEQGRAHQESARPDRQSEIGALNQAFDAAVAALKESRLGGAGRGTALYALPWYMIIGPPAAGKSTALLRSGLNFPFTPGERKAVRGVGGTRNCDWWFSDQAILLDTAGRYTSEDEDLDEWLGFLRLLRRYRRRRPLNGLIVAVSIADVITAKPDELEELATQVRSRIDQVIQELALALPIYVLFTKCDLLSGFVEYFADLTKSARAQVLGCTVPPTALQDVEGCFSAEFDLLAERLRRRGLARLPHARSHQRAEVFQFPLQFSAARGQLVSFVTQLLGPNPYHETPRLRGVYFCSGTQEGRPIDRVITALTRALGLRELAGGGLAAETTKKSYFLHDVFTRVIFPDKDLAGMTAAGLVRRGRLRLAALGLALLSCLAILGGTITAFINNRLLVSGTVDLSQRSRIITPDDPRQVTDSLRALDRLGERVDQLRRHAADGPPWLWRLGYYQGTRLLEPAQAVLLKRLRRAFVEPAGTELEATLVDVASAADAASKETPRDFDLLKAYLMVTDRKRLELDAAVPVLLEQWRKRLHPDVASEGELLERNARRYLAALAGGRAGWLDRDETVIRNVRQALRSRDAEYRRMVGQAAQRLQPLTIREMLRGRIQTVISAQYDVPGIYTRQGWSRFIRARLAQRAVVGGGVEPWVLGEEEGKDLTARLRQRYFEQYVAAWQRFLRGVSVQQPSTAADALLLLERLTDPPALYDDLFAAVVYNTELPLVDAPTGSLRGAARLLGGRAGRALGSATRLGLDKAAGRALADADTPVSEAFRPLHELVIPGDGADGRAQVSGLRQYLDQLEAVREALAGELKQQSGGGPAQVPRVLEEAQRVTKGVLALLPGGLRRLVQDLFFAPLQMTDTTARAEQSGRSGRAFSNELCAGFSERLAGRYPFARSSRDALMQDVIEFFAPRGTVWSYYDAQLRERLPRRGDRFEAPADGTVPAPVVAFINRAWQVSRALFPFGSETPLLRFEVRPRPAILAAGAGYQISEIVLEVEGRAMTYRNGPPELWTLEWRGQGGRSRIVVRGGAGLREEISYDGDWSLPHLMERAKVRREGGWYAAEWSFQQGKIRIPMDVRPSRSSHPLFGLLTLDCR